MVIIDVPSAKNFKTIMYEVLIPKRIDYYGKIEEVLETLFDPDLITKEIQERWQHYEPEIRESWLAHMVKVFKGYSIYEVDGRFVNTSKPITHRERKNDERVIVVRFYFPMDDDEWPEEQFRYFLSTTMYHLVSAPLYRLLNESAIWITETTVDNVYIVEKPEAPLSAKMYVKTIGGKHYAYVMGPAASETEFHKWKDKDDCKFSEHHNEADALDHFRATYKNTAAEFRAVGFSEDPDPM